MGKKNNHMINDRGIVYDLFAVTTSLFAVTCVPLKSERKGPADFKGTQAKKNREMDFLYFFIDIKTNEGVVAILGDGDPFSFKCCNIIVLNIYKK